MRIIGTVVLLFGMQSGLAGQVPADVEAAHRAMRESGRYQFDSPDGEERPGSSLAKGRGRTASPETERVPGRGRDNLGAMHPPSEWLGDVMLIVLVILGMGVVATVLVAVWRGRHGPSAQIRKRGVESERDALPGPPEVLGLTDSEELARAGRFVEAMRALLESAARLARAGAALRMLTGRELAAVVGPTAPGSEHLRTLIGSVERVLFAGEVAGRAQYEVARDAFRQWELAQVGAPTS